MNNSYSSRQRKIYSDYSSFDTEKLLGIINRRQDYNPDIISVINDILKERNVPVPEIPEKKAPRKVISAEKPQVDYTAEFRKDQELRSFIEKLREKDPEEILSVIKQYSEFRPPAVEAALTVAVDKGLISWDLKALLQAQIMENRKKHVKRDGKFGWERTNAFEGLFKDYSDDDLYKIIDAPSGVVIDVYHAVLSVALKRELISTDEFDNYFSDARKSMRSEEEVKEDDFLEYIFDKPAAEVRADIPDPEIEKEKYWKCPSCGELVELDLGVCWKCETPMPEQIVHPTYDEMSTEIEKESDLGAWKWIIPAILFVIAAGVMLINGYIHNRIWHPKSNWLPVTAVFIAGFLVYYIIKVGKINRK